MKHVFQYEGKKALIDGYGKKELIDPGVYTWFGAPADAMLPLYIRAVRADKWYYNACSIRKNSHEFSIEFPICVMRVRFDDHKCLRGVL